MLRLGAYVRISDDEKDENGAPTREGVSRQLKDCRGKIAAIGGVLVRVYDDNNITAAKEGVVRPDFLELLKDLEDGVIDGFVFYHSDRVARLELDAAMVCSVYRRKPKLIGLSVHGGTDLSTDEGRAMFMMQAVMGGMEVSATRRRVTRKNKDSAAKGRMHGSRQAFGWEEDNRTAHKQHKALLNKAVREIPRGKRVGTIQAEWVAAGVGPTKYAKGDAPLRHKTVRDRIVNPRIAGFRVYVSDVERGDISNLWLPDHILMDETTGEPVKGDWEVLVDPDEWWAAVTVLNERRMARSTDHNSKAAKGNPIYFLSGIARCGKCSTPMYAGGYSYKELTEDEKAKLLAEAEKAGKPAPTIRSKARSAHRYRCEKKQGGCGGVARVGPAVDALVEELFLEEQRRALGKATPVVDTEQHSERLREIAEEIDAVNVRRKDKRLSMGRALDLIEELETEQAELNLKTRKLNVAKAQAAQSTPSLLKDWEGYPMEMKRHHLLRSIRAVLIHPAKRGVRVFNPELIEIAWNE